MKTKKLFIVFSTPKILEFSVEIEAIKSVLTDKQKAEIVAKKNDLSNQIRNNGSLDLILDYLR